MTGDITNIYSKSGSTKTKGFINTARLSTKQLLYDFDKTSKNIKSAKNSLFASDEDIKSNISLIIFETKKAYHNILREQQRINLYKEMIQIDILHLEQVNAYHDAGIKTLIDVTDAKLQLSNTKLKLLKSTYALKCRL